MFNITIIMAPRLIFKGWIVTIQNETELYAPGLRTGPLFPEHVGSGILCREADTSVPVPMCVAMRLMPKLR